MQSLPISLEARDITLLRGLFESRVMSSVHVASLYFNGSRDAAIKRLQKIKAAGLVGERKRHVSEPSILYLTRKGFTVLQGRNLLLEYPPLPATAFERRANVSELTIRHELEIMDVKTAFHVAISNLERLSIDQFSTWPRLSEFEVTRPGYGGRETPVRPDGFIRINVQGEFVETYFLEVDRSSKTQDKLVAQAMCYREYYFGGGFAVRNGTTRDKFKEFPFRVLIVCKSADRRNNTAERLLLSNPPISTMVWLSTLAEVTANPLGPIWIRPQDYRPAVAGTRFDVDRKGKAIVNHPQPERNAVVEAQIQRFRLLSEP